MEFVTVTELLNALMGSLFAVQISDKLCVLS
jgi:hypothetical protein